MKDLWVFGYGSLLWNPGFAVAETRQARLHGWRRSFCMTSIHHRGTLDAPGLVLALDRAEDALCHGVAFRVDACDAGATLAYLRERELVSSAYLETRQSVTLDCGQILDDVLTYVIDPDHAQYCTWPLEAQAQIIAHAIGGRGPNDEYLENTARQLQLLGLPDPDLDWLVARVRQIKAG